MVWGPLWRNAAFWLSGLTGYRFISGPHWIDAALWVACIVALTGGGRGKVRDLRRMLLALIGAIVLLASTLLGPFSSGGVGYVCLRMGEGCYLLLVVIATMAEIPPRWGMVAALCSSALVGSAALRGWHISQETATLEPLIARMEPNAAVYPWMWDPFSPELDDYDFQVHLHDVFYYHLEKGGISPYLFATRSASGTPVSYADGMKPPAPPENRPHFLWEEHGAAYRYFLVRGGNASHWNYMQMGATLLATSGRWRLYEHKPSASQK